MHFSTPYRSESNGRFERQVQESDKVLRMTPLELPDENVKNFIPLAVAVLNSQPHQGYTGFELFHG